ncbi:LacI family DNA-binding transcriptional regulator [Opitutus terrae]|uniref:Transcriptional regulator, LacI family n=1 Tax=Opitutus terrae (strain DSM 11246 / JCM 15787 / PB90-1) TaxID=452637 RepID=B1ZN31_OPITP|nr:LacI family DNA-binding transcriptional regulator [Opitutus terrae]ACB76483.1 transcriptional regulator, LacI family [Opitutus terrae PB90-1]
MPTATAESSRRVTITDVAKRAGVHYTTVSMALRNHPRLPATTRERLRALAEEMGYRPDPVLQALMNYRGQRKPHRQIATLAYVTKCDTRWGWKQSCPDAEFFAGASHRASELGYEVEHFWLGEPGLTPHRLSVVLHSRGIVGVILASQHHESNVPLQFDWAKFSAVKIDSFPHQPGLHHVANDQFAAIRLVMQRVTAAGYRRIGLAVPPRCDPGAALAWSAGLAVEQRMMALADQLPPFIFPDSPPDSTPHELDHRAARDAFQGWLRRFAPEVLISNGAFARPQLDALGLSIPRDLAFVDMHLQQPDGKTAGIRQNCRRVGELSVDLLTRDLQQHALGVPEFPTTTLVEGTWFDGESLPSRVPAPAETPSLVGSI